MNSTIPVASPWFGNFLLNLFLPPMASLFNRSWFSRVIIMCGRQEVVLKWIAKDPDEDEVIDDVFFGTQDPPQLIKENHSDSLLEVNTEADKTYYWDIEVKEGRGAKAIGEVWKFKT